LANKGVIIAISYDNIAIRFVGYNDEEGHKRSHLLRDTMDKNGAKATIVKIIKEEVHATHEQHEHVHS